MTLQIREIQEADAEAAARLSGQLGYAVDVERMRERIARLADTEHHTVLVACVEDAVAGWVDVGIVQHLQGEAYGEVGGLVVADGFRSRGIGRELMARAERWVLDCGVEEMLVRSRVDREDAHRFYLRDGYSRVKTSAVFSKRLAN